MIGPISEVLWQCSEHGKTTIGHEPCPDCEKEDNMTNEDKNIYLEPAYIKALDLDTRYQEYALLCTNGDVTPMPYDVWLEWDEHVYQKHVREAGSALDPATFQRMQEPESRKADMRTAHEMAKEIAESTSPDFRAALEQARATMPDLERKESGKPEEYYPETIEYLKIDLAETRSRLDSVTKENESLVADLAVRTCTICSLREQVQKLHTSHDRYVCFDDPGKQELIDNYESQKADLWKKIDELRGANQLLRAENEELNQENEELSLKLHALQTNPSTTTGQLRQDSEAINYQNACLLEENERLNKENEELSNDLDKLHEGTPLAVFGRGTPTNQPLFPHYYRAVPRNTTHVDVYWVLKAWEVADPCVQHALKKLIAAGRRGAKDSIKDLTEARDSISRAIELENTK